MQKIHSQNKAQLILASGSPYRRELLARLGVEFSVEAPGADESPQQGESPSQLAIRLARGKAEVISTRHSEAVVIGSDQVAVLGTEILGKPGTVERARRQLQAASGRSVAFHTAVSIRRTTPPHEEVYEDLTTVWFRELDDDLIDRYLEREDVLDCAGSFKAEGRGIVLFERIENSDPTALIGLPMIWVSHALRRLGFRIP